MRRSVDERGPIAAWLIRARARFHEPGSARSWTADQFLAALRDETGWAPTRTTYARWESGAVRPDQENLDRVVAFYAARGIPGPDAPEPVAAPQDDLAAVIAAIDRLTAAVQAQTDANTAATAALAEGLLRALGRLDTSLGHMPDGRPDPRSAAAQ